jgi:hypothetical protein
MNGTGVRIRSVMIMLSVLAVIAAAPTFAGAAPTPTRSYVCVTQFKAIDESAHAATLTVRIADHIPNYLKQFTAGEHLVLVWDMINKTQADTVLALWKADDLKTPALRSGYILPIEFVSGDADGRTVTFTARVPDKALSAAKSWRPGQWLKLTVPMDQPNDTAAITTIETIDPPSSGEHTRQ